MNSLWRIFWLELTSLVRSWTVLMLLAASLAWMFAMPRLVTGDGTVEGFRELFVSYGLGGVFTLLVIAILASATGSIASEREAKRLQLTEVRPVSAFAIAWGKMLALAAAAAFVLAFPCAVLVCSSEYAGIKCSHVFRPQLESPEEEAAKVYDAFMADPDTSPVIKRARKSTILRILAQRAKDHYQTVHTNSVASWTFPGFAEWAKANPSVEPSMRLRFATDFSQHSDVRGLVSASGFLGTVSNVTQTAVVIPMRREALASGGTGAATAKAAADVVSFANMGGNAVMLRPRQDVELLIPADAFAWNVLRSYVVMVAVLMLVAAIGVFLGAGLSRPVALFVAFVLLIVSEMSPSVIDQYPDQLESDAVDRIGLAMTRAVGRMSKPVSELSPISPLADNDCVEARDAAWAFAVDFCALPVAFSLLSAFLLRRKQE